MLLATATDWGSALITYGPLGIFVFLFIIGWIVPKPTHDRVLQDNERLHTENEILRKSLEDRILPAAIRLADTIGALVSTKQIGSGESK